MNDLFKAWTDSMLAGPQTMFKAMFPLPAAGAAPGAPVQGSQLPGLDEQFAQLRDTWKASLEKWAEFAAQEGKNPGTLSPQALGELFSPERWSGVGAFDANLRQVLEGPRFATLWELDRKLLELAQLAQQRDRDVAAYQAIVQKAWNQAFERFTASLYGQGGSRPDTWRGLTDRWLKVANDTLVEVHRSDEFVQAQRRMLRSSSDHRLQERRIAEAWCEACHIPTRTEMDETQRQLVELRRQVRALRRERASRPDDAPKPGDTPSSDDAAKPDDTRKPRRARPPARTEPEKAS